MGEVGGTCEIIVFFMGLFYVCMFKKRNITGENKKIWNLTAEEKATYEALTNYTIDETDIRQTREHLIENARDGSALCKAPGLLNLVIQRVFSLRERRHLNLALYDPNILMRDKNNRMHLTAPTPISKFSKNFIFSRKQLHE